MPPSKLATRPMAAIPLDTAKVVLVDHGAGAGFGILVDGRPVPNVMLLPAGQVDRYNVIVGGVFYLAVTKDEAMRWAPVLARWSETITGTTNGHIAAGMTIESGTAMADQAEKAWRERGNCLGVAPGTMFPDDMAGVAAAKAVCEGCPVTEECLDYAQVNGEDFGIWGGLSARARRRLRTPRSRSAAATHPPNRCDPTRPSPRRAGTRRPSAA